MQLVAIVLGLLIAVLALSKSSQSKDGGDNAPSPSGQNPQFNLYGTDTHLINGRYVQYLMGWKDTTQRNDHIYVRYSDDGENWGVVRSVIKPEQIPGAHHVGDPSMTLHTNKVDGSEQYTMFFTVCKGGCIETAERNDNTIWSAVSSDGENWTGFQPLLTSSSGSAEPSAVFTGGGWDVYYADRLDPSKIKVAKVSGTRHLLSIKTYFEDEEKLGAITGPDVSAGRVMFNVHRGQGAEYRVDMADIHNGKVRFLVQNSLVPGEPCAATTPDQDEYGNRVFISRATRANSGVCMNTRHSSIESVNV